MSNCSGSGSSKGGGGGSSTKSVGGGIAELKPKDKQLLDAIKPMTEVSKTKEEVDNTNNYITDIIETATPVLTAARESNGIEKNSAWSKIEKEVNSIAKLKTNINNNQYAGALVRRVSHSIDKIRNNVYALQGMENTYKRALAVKQSKKYDSKEGTFGDFGMTKARVAHIIRDMPTFIADAQSKISRELKRFSDYKITRTVNIINGMAGK